MMSVFGNIPLIPSSGQLFSTPTHIAEKAGAVVVENNPAYTSQILSYRDEFVFTD